jgi:hypothetical protein
MVTAPEIHDVHVGAPWYAPPSQNVAIHRYFDPGFVAQFQADVSNAPHANAPQLFAWQQTDIVSASDPRLKLRRPVHRTFHMVAWEAACRLPTAPIGYPAIAPDKIDSAGFVLRDVSSFSGASPAAPNGFQIFKGKPIGWAPVTCLKADPDAARHVRSLSLAPRSATPSPGFTGEETFPLHVLSLTAGPKPHTLLYGFLSIGGGDFVSPNSPANPPAFVDDLPWPFGLAGRSKGPPATYESDLQIDGGKVHSATAAFLRVILGRYQLADPTAWDPSTPQGPANLNLIKILCKMTFFTQPPTKIYGDALRQWASDHAIGGVSLGSLLHSWATQPPSTSNASLAAESAAQSTAQDFLASLNEAYPSGSVTLPAAPGFDPTTASLLVTEDVAASLRSTLALRMIQAAAVSASATPSPKLISGPSGSYAVVPFVRVVRPNGCEKIFWGLPSAPFAVAAMHDVDAARPTLIEMPDLKDAMKGAAVGASFKMPPSLADLANGLSTSSAIKALYDSGAQPSGGLGIGYICSFSLPVISICAMISLSIILSLLNIFLGWMAWVKICLPIPQEEPPP